MAQRCIAVNGVRRILFGILAVAMTAMGMPASAMDEATLLAQGRKLFQTDADPACAICHTLADAGTQGKVGPVLDLVKPSEERVLNALRNGKGRMPPFVDHLTVEQMKILAKYVSTVTGGNAQ